MRREIAKYIAVFGIVVIFSCVFVGVVSCVWSQNANYFSEKGYITKDKHEQIEYLTWHGENVTMTVNGAPRNIIDGSFIIVNSTVVVLLDGEAVYPYKSNWSFLK
jgi:hypothetical protein